MIVLDKENSWKVVPNSPGLDGNVLRLRGTLELGLQYLYVQIHRIESHIQAAMPPEKFKYSFMGAGSHGLSPEAHALIECGFHWYGVSACNFVRITGWLAAKTLHSTENAEQFARRYVEETIPQVKKFRDKVAAHLSNFDPVPGGRNEDNPADLLVAPLPFTLENGRYYCGTLNAGVRRSGQASQSQHDMTWSLTETHERLAERYSWVIDPQSIRESQAARTDGGPLAEEATHSDDDCGDDDE